MDANALVTEDFRLVFHDFLPSLLFYLGLGIRIFQALRC